jgi:perosamine synthetase
VYWAFRSLALPPGSLVWMPSFHCGVEVQAAIDAGLRVDFFPVRADLTVDPNELEARVRTRPGCVLLIHYFGQGQPGTAEIAETCERLGVALIEDCCHALFSRRGDRWLGTFGPIAAFSLPKVLGTLDGGLLCMDGSRLNGMPGLAAPGGRARWPILALLERKGVLPAWANWQARLPAIPSGPETPALPVTAGGATRDYTRRPTRLGSWMAARAQCEAVRERRRNNWFWLESKLGKVRGYRNALGPLAEGTSPLGLPLLVRDRPLLLQALHNRRVESYVFGQWPHPTLDSSAFPETAILREHLLCIPVHQHLTRSQLETLAEALASFLPRHALDS